MLEKPKFRLYKSPENFYSIVIPIKWESIVVEGVPAFFEHNANGVLQIYAFKNLKSNCNLDIEFEKYLLEQHNKSDANVLSFLNMQKYQMRFCDFFKDSRFWMIYMMVHKEKMILATYNGDTKPSLDELEKIHTSINSVIFL